MGYKGAIWLCEGWSYRACSGYKVKCEQLGSKVLKRNDHTTTIRRISARASLLGSITFSYESLFRRFQENGRTYFIQLRIVMPTLYMQESFFTWHGIGLLTALRLLQWYVR